MKKIFKSFAFWLILINLTTLGILMTVISKRYTASQTWNKVLLNSKQADIDPIFVKNRYSSSASRDLEHLTELSKALKTIDENKRLDDDDYSLYQGTLKNAQEVLDKANVKSGESYDNVRRLSLYLSAYQFLKDPYKKVRTKKVNSLIAQFLDSKVSMYPMSKTYLKELDAVASRYNKLDSFISLAYSTLGTRNGSVLTVKAAVDKDDVEELESAIENDDLTVFAPVKRFKALLESSQMTTILKANQDQKDYEAWSKALSVFDGLKQSQYIAVNSILTYQDAKKAKLDMTGLPILGEGESIDKNSKVVKLVYDGKELTAGQYFKKGSDVIAQIQADVSDAKKDDDKNQDQEQSSSQSSSSSSSSQDQTQDQTQDQQDQTQDQQAQTPPQ